MKTDNTSLNAKQAGTAEQELGSRTQLTNLGGSNTMEAKLLASAPTLDKLTAFISEYFGGSTIALDGETINNANGPIPGFRVMTGKGRFRFERTCARPK